MERKIGEVFEHNGEWLQCVECDGCTECAFQSIFCDKIKNVRGECVLSEREDRNSVIFKKLEKFGEPYISSRNKKRYQLYRCFCLPIITKDRRIEIGDANWVGIEIKQNKEDMENKKLFSRKVQLRQEDIDYVIDIIRHVILPRTSTYDSIIKEIKQLFISESQDEENNLKPFNFEAAKAGKPVCTRDGRKARIICFDAKGDKPIIALIEMGVAETTNNYPIDGKAISTKETPCDLMMLPEKKEGWVNVYKVGARLETGGDVHSTRDAAIKCIDSDKKHIATVKIEWEE